MLKPVVPVLLALAALATPADASPPSPLGVVAEMHCQRLTVASSPIAPDTIVTLCPDPKS